MQTLVNSVYKSLPKAKSQPLKVIALGDSLVYGYGDPEGGGWVERLRRCWMYSGDSGHVLYNLGVRGDRVRQVANRLEIEFRHRGELRNRVPDLLILSVGVNDSARIARPNGKNYTELDSFQKDIAVLLDLGQSLCPVIFVGMVPVDEFQMPFLNTFYYNLADQFRYKEATKEACLSRHIPYLDIFDLWMERGEDWRRSRLCDDGLHPNVAGYQSLLQDVFSWEPIVSLAKVPDATRPALG